MTEKKNTRLWEGLNKVRGLYYYNIYVTRELQKRVRARQEREEGEEAERRRRKELGREGEGVEKKKTKEKWWQATKRRPEKEIKRQEVVSYWRYTVSSPTISGSHLKKQPSVPNLHFNGQCLGLGRAASYCSKERHSSVATPRASASSVLPHQSISKNPKNCLRNDEAKTYVSLQIINSFSIEFLY